MIKGRSERPAARTAKPKKTKGLESAQRLAPLTLEAKKTVVDALVEEVASKALAALETQRGTRQELTEVDVREGHGAGSGDTMRIEPEERMGEIVTRLRVKNIKLETANALIDTLQGLCLDTAHRKAQVGSLIRLKREGREGIIINVLLVKGGNGTRLEVPGVGIVTCVSPESQVGIALLGTSSLEENNGVSKGDKIPLGENSATIEAIV